ncbi:MAG: InlB B-repeat-containing protein, partial [Tannerella sp.]|nr:InlB B-repeat-containing protein [Tannerella sp.]
MKRILLTIVTMIFATTLVSCDKNENDDKLKEFTVFFETGDDDCMVVLQKVREGEKATKPDDPTRSGYTFMAWFKEAELTNEWKFDFDGVTSDMTLYAKWIECTVKEEDRITFTWQAETGVNKNVTVRATAGETFTVNWGDNSQIIT